MLGNATGSIAADPSGTKDPTTLGGSLALGTGTGSTAGINDVRSPLGLGAFLAGAAWAVPGTSGSGGETVTIMIIAYSGSSYATANFRGHGTAFTMSTSASTSPSPAQVGNHGFTAFTINQVPEPSVLALSGLGGAALMMLRRKKA